MVATKLFRRRFTSPGAAPGEFVIAKDAVATTIRGMKYNAETIEEKDLESMEEAHALIAPGYVTWIDIQGLGDRATIEACGRLFGIHPLALADVVNVGQRPKVEEYEDVLYAVIRMVMQNGEGTASSEQVSLFIGPGYVLSFQERHGDCLEPVRSRLRQGRKMLRSSGSDYLGCMLLDAIVDGYFPVLEQYGEVLEGLQSRVISSPSQAVLSEIYAVKRELLGFRRAVWPMRDAFNQMLRDQTEFFDDHVIPYLRDTTDHIMQVVDVLETHREVASSFVDVYLSSVSQRTNEVMRVLTIFATLFIPLTFIAGIYGMNFENIPELHWKHGYAMFWGVCLLLAAALGIGFYKIGWLGGSGKSPSDS